MILTSEQRELLRPAMEEFEKGLRTSSYSFHEIWRISQVREEIGLKRNVCGSCGPDKFNYYQEIYNIWKQ